LWITAIFILLWLLVWGYVIANKKSLIEKVNAELTSRVKGEINIGNIEPGLLSTFPNVSIHLSQVIVRDSLWKYHHHDLLNARNIYIRLGLFSLFTGSPEISKVIIENGSLLIFSDTSGYSNEYMFQSKNSAAATNSGAPRRIPDIEMNNVSFILDLKDRDKLFNFNIAHLNCNVKQTNNTLHLNIRTNILVNSLAFNVDKGSFVKGKTITGRLNLDFDRTRKKLEFKDVHLDVDKHSFSFTGMFDFSSTPPLYYLAIKTNNINYRSTSLLLSENIKQRLDRFDVEKPFDVMAVIDGSTLPNKMPLVDVQATIKNSNLSTTIGEFTNASLKAHFSNQVNLSEQRSDANSRFTFTGCSAIWEKIPLKSDSFNIANLEHPIMDCDLHTAFELAQLNELLGASTIEFKNGHCNADIKYHGVVMKSDTAPASIFGTVNLDNAAIEYTPRNLTFTDCSGSLVFDDKDFIVKQLKAHSGSTSLLMNGSVKNLTSLIDKSPEKLILNLNISSPKIVLSDFISFLSKRVITPAADAKKNSTKKLLKLATQVDKILNDCSVELQINADRLIYKKFNADKVAATLLLTDKMVALKNVLVAHAGGTLQLNGSLTEGPVQNMVRLAARMTNVDVTKTLTAFDNFGQDGIVDKNLKGRLSADINISGLINTKAELDPNSLRGIVDLRIKDGELINFEPVKKISQTAFKNRDFSNIRFADLTDKLEITGSEIKVNRMEIQSSVLTMFVEGIYDVEKGTDLEIQIPLSNLSKRGEDFELKNKGVKSKTGMSINLRARTGEDGKAKITWDPFKHALKKKEKEVRDDKSPANSIKVIRKK
jgi:hypothetical protein